MWTNFALFIQFIKRNLGAYSAGAFLIAAARHGYAQTFTFNNSAQDNIWNQNLNWSQGTPPIATSIARIPAGVPGSGGKAPWLYLSTGSLSASAAAGSLIINADYGEYRGLFARKGGSGSAMLAFGTSSAPGYLEFDPSTTILQTKRFDFGAEDTAAVGTLEISIPLRLDIRMVESSSIHNLGKIVGTGSLTLGLSSGTASSTFETGSTAANSSDFTGGVRVDSGISMWIRSSPNLSSGSIITSGPIGLGTCTLNGGTLVAGVLDGTFANYLDVVSNSSIRVGKVFNIIGDVRLNGNRLTSYDVNALTFLDAGWSAADSGTLAFADDPNLTGTTSIVVSGGTMTFGGAIGEGTTSTLFGRLRKDGAGTFELKHFRTKQFSANEGVLVVNASIGENGAPAIVGNNTGVSRTGSLFINSAAAIDLKNNDLVIDYDTTSPLGTASLNSGISGYIASGYAAGSWNGNGLRSSTAANTSNQYALGYGEASDLLGLSGSGTATFAGQVVDATTVLVGFTYGGDADLNGVVNLDDFTRLAAGFGSPGLWPQGDFNYNGIVNLDDYTILAAYFGSSPALRRGGPDPLQELYVAMLDYPQIYWESRGSPELWAMFAPFESLNLGPIPPMPEAMRNSIPEPAGAVAILALFAGTMRRRRRA